MSEDMAIVLTITGVGMTTVFLVLVFLSYCFMALKLVAGDKKPKVKDQPSPVADAGQPDADLEADVVDEDELAVVIAAALSAYLGGEQVVTSIRRMEDAAGWSRVGRHDQMVAAL